VAVRHAVLPKAEVAAPVGIGRHDLSMTCLDRAVPKSAIDNHFCILYTTYNHPSKITKIMGFAV